MSARVTQNALYALGDVRQPARIAVIRLVVTVVVAVLIIFQADRITVLDGTISGWDQIPMWPPWEPVAETVRTDPTASHFGAVGLGIAALVASWVEWALLRHALANRVKSPLTTGLGMPVLAAGMAAGVSIWALRALAGLGPPIEGVLVGVIGLAIYIAALRFQGLRPRTG